MTMADQAVEHVCFLADPNRLYEHALGVFDIDLALLIAQQSQKVCVPNCVEHKMFTSH